MFSSLSRTETKIHAGGASWFQHYTRLENSKCSSVVLPVQQAFAVRDDMRDIASSCCSCLLSCTINLLVVPPVCVANAVTVNFDETLFF